MDDARGQQGIGMVAQAIERRAAHADRADGCPACATLPAVAARQGSLVVTARSANDRLHIAAVLEAMGVAPVHGPDGRLTCAVPPADLPAVAAALGERLLPDALDATRATITDAPESESGSTGATEPPTLRALLRGVERGWLIEILGQDRLDTHLQPIVNLSAGRATTFAHECLTRGRTAAGETIPAGRLFAAADRAALMFHLDRSARLASIANAARFDPSGRYFVNFMPTAIYNPTFCLQSTVAAVDEGGIDPGKITFEVIESVRMQDLPHLEKIFGVYRERGFTVALDDITGGPISGEMIALLRPDFVKLDRSLVSFVERVPDQQRSIVDVLRQCRALGVEVIAEGIERPEERDWLAGVGIRLMQGYLFARPFPA